MVERVYGVMDAESLAGDVAGVFNNMDLPAVEVPKASSCPPRKRDKKGIKQTQSEADMSLMAQPEPSPPKQEAPLTAEKGNQRGLEGVSPARLERATYGFEVRRSIHLSYGPCCNY